MNQIPSPGSPDFKVLTTETVTVEHTKFLLAMCADFIVKTPDARMGDDEQANLIRRIQAALSGAPEQYAVLALNYTLDDLTARLLNRLNQRLLSEAEKKGRGIAGTTGSNMETKEGKKEDKK